ncbi:sugar-binding protein [Pseudomonas putida]|uniref:Sugar-binding protein n=1 Tax=Pseudomonas putida TaxID=303 RepID=A0A4D6X5L4_PSEPU|nr:RHS repeat domain-containing protein [Pseudomonas putida]QCI11373.1 sugar-binding protein [Pseudomonas putida]
MAIETVIHSNAFNASSFVEGGVDPRTGQYTLGINVLPIVGNDQIGPDLPIRLMFNPFSDDNVGFGKGWYIALTQYLPGSRMLRLHTGESYKVTGTGEQPPIREKKLDSFHFHDDSGRGKRQYRVVYKSYMEEILEVYGDGVNEVALPAEVRAASGHRIQLGYTKDTQRLESIVDGNGLPLLKIGYSSGSVTLDLHPGAKGGIEPLARYTLTLENQQLIKVSLPAEVGGNWRFEYSTVHGLTCVAKVSTPYGAIERIGYGENQDPGHLLPGGGKRAAIPRVTSHAIEPGGQQPSMNTTYTYTILVEGVETARNFVGFGSGITWGDNGEDNLYRAPSSYLYRSTAHQWGKGPDGQDRVLRTVQRTYNRFHLLVREVTEQEGHVLTSETTYHGKVTDAFETQPANFQLPRETQRKWALANDASRVREEPPTQTLYDLHGNLTEVVLPVGKRTVTEYYSALGGEGCPADPDGFVRSPMRQTVYPAVGGDAPAPILRTHYRYVALGRVNHPDAIAAQVADTWLVQQQETLCEVLDDVEQAPLQVTTTCPVDKPDDLLRHGRPLLQTLCMGSLNTRTCFTYSKEVRNQHPVLVTQQRLTGFDHGQSMLATLRRHGALDPAQLHAACDEPRDVSKVITLETSLLIGEPLLNRDDNDVEIAYEYDAIRRVTRETVSPNDDRYKASRTYQYGLVGAPGEQASQTRVDVKGVAILTRIDGLGRVASEARHDADAEEEDRHQLFRECNKFVYDELGQLTEAIEYDWLTDTQMPLATQYVYDDWGQQSCEIGPDGVKRFEVHDPIGSNPTGNDPTCNMPTQTHWSESADGSLSQGKTITWFNLFEAPAQVQRFDLSGKLYGKHQYFYDGLGRNVREVDARNAVVRNTYDAFDRLVDQTLADRSVVHRDYAVHSSEDLPIQISVAGNTLGEQVFDGLNRMIASITGGRPRLMCYAPGQNNPYKVTTAAGNGIQYEYVPQLGEDPQLRRLPGKQADYTYDPANARLTWCKEEGEELSRVYFSTGQIKSETRMIGAEHWSMEYGTSLLGRQLYYVDVLGQTQTYAYDEAGRLKETALGTTQSHFFYEGLGYTQCILTLDGAQGLATELEYDHQGREVLRRFIFLKTVVEAPIEGFSFTNECVQALVDEAGLLVQGVQELGQAYSVLDQITRKSLSENGDVLREETFDYDARGRLEAYTCAGPIAYCPKDPAGKNIREQYFQFDALDNIIWLYTGFEEEDGTTGDNEATYLFDYKDPAQLSGVMNTHADYADFTLRYDLDGNMVQDDKGKTLSYDALGRLSSYDGSGYGYDALDRLSSQDA